MYASTGFVIDPGMQANGTRMSNSEAFLVYRNATEKGIQMFVGGSATHDYGYTTIALGRQETITPVATVQVENESYDTNLLVRRQSAPGIELKSEAAMSTITTAASQQN